MRKTLLLLILFTSYIVKGQNLVPNPSFEEQTQCPTDQNQVNYAIGWENFGGSPDYFNSCATNPLFSVPNNWGGHQQGYQGNAYAGIGIFSSLEQDFSEYFGAELNSPLTIGEKYYVSFKISLGLDSNYGWTGAANNIGILLSTVPFSVSNPPEMNNFSHINFVDPNSDSLNWKSISDSFIADSAYSYIVVGRFFNDSETTFIPIQEMVFEDAAYYFVDDICISPDSLACNPSLEVYALQKETIVLYPNPIQDFLYLESETYPVPYSISALNGKILTKGTIGGDQEAIDLSAFANGMYFIVLDGKKNRPFLVTR